VNTPRILSLGVTTQWSPTTVSVGDHCGRLLLARSYSPSRDVSQAS
jgi:hypothetical protein